MACYLAPSLGMAAEKAPPAPDMALLNYLAEMVEVDGELVGAIDMAQTRLPVEQAAEKTVNKPAVAETTVNKESEPPVKEDK